MGPKIFCLKIFFLSGLNGKFHMNFAVDNVFEILVCTKNFTLSFQGFILFTLSVNDVVSTKNGHTKASKSFQLMIYDGLIDFFICKR